MIWVVSDGTAGMRLQAIALADSLANSLSNCDAIRVEDIILSPPPLLRYLPRLARLLPSASLRAMLRYADGVADQDRDIADIIITCGRRMAGVSIALRRLDPRGLCRTIHIQDPRLPSHYFDLLLVPEHDPARGANVITSRASLNRLSPEKIDHAATLLGSKWRDLPAPMVAVLLGGKNRRYQLSEVMIETMVKKLAEFATVNEASLAIIPSRRTPDRLLMTLSRQLEGQRFAIADTDEANPYPGILALADAVIVTSDSVNMASEAAMTGKPVLIADWQVETGRIAAFHRTMIKAGHTAPMTTKMPKNKFTPLCEMPMITAAVKRHLGLD